MAGDAWTQASPGLAHRPCEPLASNPPKSLQCQQSLGSMLKSEMVLWLTTIGCMPMSMQER